MKKKIVALLLTLAMCSAAIPQSVQAGGDAEDYYEEAEYDLDEDDDDVIEANTLIPEDIRVSPAKKTLWKGGTFTVKIVAAGGSEFDDLSEEEWDYICERSIESVVFQSTKSNVASVNRSGRVKARRRGSAVIKTTVNLSSGDSITFKTKVTVKK